MMDSYIYTRSRAYRLFPRSIAQMWIQCIANVDDIMFLIHYGGIDIWTTFPAREDKFGLDLRMDSSALLQCLIIHIETFDEMNLHILTMSFLERTSFYSKGMFTTWTSHFFSLMKIPQQVHLLKPLL